MPPATGPNNIMIDIFSQFHKQGFDEGIQYAQKFNKTIQQTRKDMLFLGLGTLFFGMALQRTFGGLLSAGTDTFRNITESTAGTMTAMTGLAAAGEYLKFTIGDALNSVLEPLMPFIIALVEAFTDFVQQHPESIWVIIGGALAGIALLTFGTITAFLASLGKTFGGAEGSGILANLGQISDKLQGLGKVGAGVIGIGLAIKGFEQFSEKDFMGGLSSMVASAGLVGVSIGKVKFKGGVALMSIAAGISILKDAVGGNLDLASIQTALTGLLGNVFIIALATGNLPAAGIVGAILVGLYISSVFGDKRQITESAQALLDGTGLGIDTRNVNASLFAPGLTAPGAIFAGGAGNFPLPSQQIGTQLEDKITAGFLAMANQTKAVNVTVNLNDSLVDDSTYTRLTNIITQNITSAISNTSSTIIR